MITMLDAAAPGHGRLPWPTPGSLGSRARAVHDAITGGPRASGPRLFSVATDDGRLEGPFNAMLTAPEVGLALQELGARIRYGSTLSDRVREIAILVVAAHHRSDYEWYAHEAMGRAVGLSEDEISALQHQDTAISFDVAEATTIDLVRSLLTNRLVHDTTMTRAIESLGIERITELVVLVGYYELLDLLMRTWETPLPSGISSPFGRGSVGQEASNV